MFDAEACATFVDELCAEGLSALGVQVAASCDGSVWNHAAGRSSHGPMEERTLHQTWCLTKPVVALVALRILEDAGIGPDDRLVDVLGADPGVGARATLRQLLSHDTGSRHPTAADVRMTPRRRRGALVAERRSEVARPAYSEYYAWSVLEACVSAGAGTSLGEEVQERLDHAGLDIHVVIDDARYASIEPRIGCYFWLDGMRPVPLLQDATRSVVLGSSIALGGYATMSAIVRWYELLARARSAPADAVTLDLFPSSSLLHDVLRWDRQTRHDEVLDRDCQFAGGFMVDLPRHDLGASLDGSAIGHAGWVGSSFAITSGAGGTAAALVNVVSFDRDDLQLWRPQLVSLLLGPCPEAP